MPQVLVEINGQSYRMACDEGQESHLTALAARLDGYASQLKGSFGEIGDQRLTVMAGVMVTDELSEAERKIRLLEAEVAELKGGQTTSSSSEQDQKIAEKLGEATRSIKQAAFALNANNQAS